MRLADGRSRDGSAPATPHATRHAGRPIRFGREDALMARVAVVYGSSEGQTATVAKRVADTLAEAGHEATLLHAQHLPSGFAVDAFDAVVVGASVHMGSHQAYVARFVREHVSSLDDRPSAFFSVSLTAAEGTETARETARGLLDDFLADTGWEPDVTAVFPGALKYSEYGLLTRFVMKRIARKYGGDTDASRDYEYTDWDAVERFAGDVAALLA